MKQYLFLVFLLSSLSAFGQCPTLSTSFSSQDEIDQFVQDYPDCEELYVVYITGDVDNLSGLSQLTKIDNLVITESKLEKLEGLNNVKSINTIHISKNDWLASLSGLDLSFGPNSIEIVRNSRLEECTILCNWIEQVTRIHIENNAKGCSHRYDIQCDDFVSGSIFYDKNKNKIQDDDEFGIPNIFARENSLGYWNLSNLQGRFGFKATQGMQVEVRPKIDYDKWILTTDSTSYSYVYDAIGAKNDLFFGLVPREEKHALDVKIIKKFGLDFSIIIENNGAFKESGKLLMNYDSRLTLKTVYPDFLENDEVNSIAKWEFSDIQPFGKMELNVIFSTMPSHSDEFEIEVHVEDFREGVTGPKRDLVKWVGTFGNNCIVSSSPPNNVQVSTDDAVAYGFSYGGNGSGVIVSQFNNDLENFEFVYGDAYPEIKIEGRAIRYTLMGGGHFFVYRAKPVKDLVEGTLFKNTISTAAGFSPCSREVEHTLVSPLRSWEINDGNLLIGPNPTSDFFRMQYNVDYINSESKLLIYNSLGQFVKSYSAVSNKQYFVNGLSPGFYTVILYTSDAKRKIHTGKLFVQ